MDFINKIRKKFILTGNKQKVVINLYWAVLGKIVNILSGLFVGILIAKHSGAEQYGLMNYVIRNTTSFSILSSFGMDNIEIENQIVRIIGGLTSHNEI